MRNVAKKRAAFRILIAALLVIFAAAAATGMTLARYRSTARSVGEMTMEYSFSSDSIHLLSRKIENGEITDEPAEDEDGNYLPLGGWSEVYEGGTIYQLKFLLSNAKAEDDVASFAQDGYLEIYVTDPVPEDIIIQLETGSCTYTAAGEAAEQGNPYYESYGPGTLFGFKNKNGEKICHFLPNDTECLIPMTLTVWGAGADPSALTLIANGIPHN